MSPTLRSADVTALREGAAEVLLGNLKEGWDAKYQTDYAYTCPSRTGGYPWQWFWDSCFHAIVLSSFDVKLAQKELRTLWKSQHPDGFIPHVVHWGSRFNLNLALSMQSKLSWRPKSTALIQPPVLAQAALAVAERSQDEAFLAEAVDRVRRYYLWLHDHRDPDADSLISVITPYETGMDHLPAYDEALGARNPSRLGLQARDRLLDLHNLVLGRNYNLDAIFRRDRFNVEDVLVNCLYAQGLRAVSKLCAMAGDEPTADPIGRMAQRTEDALLCKLCDVSGGAVSASRSVVSARFTSRVGLSPSRYLNAWRMELAAQRLSETQDSIAEIAAGAGYELEAAFNRAFKRHAGDPPGNWRRQRRATVPV